MKTKPYELNLDKKSPKVRAASAKKTKAILAKLDSKGSCGTFKKETSLTEALLRERRAELEREEREITERKHNMNYRSNDRNLPER